MKKFTLVFFVLITVLLNVQAQKAINISGYVTDSVSGEALINSIVYNLKVQKSAVTNNYGYYSLQVPYGTDSIHVSYTGIVKSVALRQKKDTVINFQLNTNIELESVLVKAEGSSIINEKLPGTMKLSTSAIQNLPQLMGENDILKALQLMPGINSASEGSTDMVAWGGNTDQNMVLLDGVPIYNPNHIFGFFSVFNDDAINSAKVHLGYIPARYNGRLSSVVDISMRDGNKSKYACKGTVGTMSAKLLVEGPIVKDKSSFLVTGRISYLDLLINPLIKHFTDYDNAGFNFYDITAKLNYTLGRKDKLFLSLYSGEDNGESTDKLVYGSDVKSNEFYTKSTEHNQTGWGNTSLVARWNHIFAGKAFANLTIDYSNYFYSSNTSNYEVFTTIKDGEEIKTENEYYFKSESNILRKGFAYDFSMPVFNWADFNAGLKAAHIELSPINKSYSGNEDDEAPKKEYSILNITPYIENQFYLYDKIDLKIGLTVPVAKTENKTYVAYLPRFNANFRKSEKFGLNLSYIEMEQEVQLLSRNKVSLASDLWVPLTDSLGPSLSKQISGGMTLALPLNLTLRTNIFYKTMENLLAYKEGATFNQDVEWKEQVTQGKGRAYGVDLIIERSKGRLTGWLSATWSRSFRTFPEINNGEECPSRYDRPIDIKTSLIFAINEKISIGANWFFYNGSVETVGTTAYFSGFDKGMPPISDVYYNDSYGVVIKRYQYNSLRMPSSHRLDLAINFSFNDTKFKSKLSIGAYNVYNKKNPYKLSMRTYLSMSREYYFLDYQSLFGIMPYISYSFSL